MYLTYEEYQVMGGTLDETAFNDIEYEAENYIDWCTFNRLWNQEVIPERVKKCIYQMIRLIDLQMRLMNAPTEAVTSAPTETTSQISSMSNDGVSISYNIISASDALAMSKRQVDETIKRNLQGVSNNLGRNLLYRGIYPGE